MYIFLQKNYPFLFCILAVITAVAQQWAGSTTTTDTITRFGVSEIIPDTISVPYTELVSSGVTVYQRYGEQWRWEYARLNYDGLHL